MIAYPPDAFDLIRSAGLAALRARSAECAAMKANPYARNACSTGEYAMAIESQACNGQRPFAGIIHKLQPTLVQRNRR